MVAHLFEPDDVPVSDQYFDAVGIAADIVVWGVGLLVVYPKMIVVMRSSVHVGVAA